MALPDPEIAFKIARGVCRHLEQLGYGALTEFPLGNGRRADVIAMNDKGDTTIIEIKSSIVDFQTDAKWPEYREYCDYFYFAVPLDFPRELIPEVCGLMVADEYGAEVLRECGLQAMNGSRRRAQLLRFAVTASQRLRRLVDPGV